MSTAAEISYLEQHGLYSRANEHDACGVGFVANIRGVKSHDIVKNALKILENLDHRGAVGADKLMGDGAGILIQLPDALYRDEMAQQGVTLPAQGEYGVGMIFLPKEHASRLACEQEMERAIKAEGQVLLGWRDVPVNRDMPMSPAVRTKEPVMRQVFIGRGNDVIVGALLCDPQDATNACGVIYFNNAGFIGMCGHGTIGTVTRQFGGNTQIGVVGRTATFSFNTPEFLDVEVGNPLGTTAGAIDWTLTGVRAGDRVNLRVSVVPEPGSYALMLAGLAALGFIARRRHRA